ncbi:MAG: AGE family epimerase/isomerase [Flavitalea sp.]
MKETLQRYRGELESEMTHILDYWMAHSIDLRYGGFHGQVFNDNHVQPNAPKGSVLNSRILWTFSSAFRFTGNKHYLQMADRALDYFLKYFVDSEYGGIYWTVDYQGNPLETRNQVYALAFAIYALSEYSMANPSSSKAKEMAVQLYHSIERYAFDIKQGGYFEAFTNDWQELKDVRLSDKDVNEKKTMNTHLHLLEAYANLYQAWPDKVLYQKTADLIALFINKIIDPVSGRLQLFFDENWNHKSTIISYGHDIEASWLTLEAAEKINDLQLAQRLNPLAVQLAMISRSGIDEDGGLWYELDPEKNQLVKEKHWWPQAEAMVGFFNAWQITGDNSFLDNSLAAWAFTQQYILDKQNGEWFWGVKEDHSVMQQEDKIGIWKCPYHNTRACIEISHRINRMLE